MTVKTADRVKETSTTTGTGTLTLAGAALGGFQTFSSAFSNGDRVPYCIVSGTAWEVGLGTYSAGTLARTTIYASTNANAAVSLGATTHDVFCTDPAAHINPARQGFAGIATGDPGATDDSSKGYLAYQSRWFLQSEEYWACSGDSVGAATWRAHAPLAIHVSTAPSTTYLFKSMVGHAVGMASEQCASLTDGDAYFDFTYGTPLVSACIGGDGYRTFWGHSAGIGFGVTTAASTCKVKSGAQGSTTDATPTAIYPNADVDQSWYVPLNGITEFTVKVCAWDDTAKIGKTWSLVGTVKRGASGAATFIGSVTKTTLQADGGAAAWDVALTIANTGTTTESALVLTVTGAAVTNIEWGASIVATQLAMY